MGDEKSKVSAGRTITEINCGATHDVIHSVHTRLEAMHFTVTRIVNVEDDFGRKAQRMRIWLDVTVIFKPTSNIGSKNR